MAPDNEDLSDKSPQSSRDEVFRSIGMYVYWFSQLEYVLRIVAVELLGLSSEQAGGVMPVIDFASICGTCRAHIHKVPAESREKGLELIKRAFQVNEDRIRVAHGFWSKGGALHVSRSSFKRGMHFSEPGELQRKAEEVKALTDQIWDLFLI